MSSDLKELFRQRLETILEDLKVTRSEETRSFLKIVLFLNGNFWNEENAQLVKRLLLLMTEHIDLLDTKEISYLQRVSTSFCVLGGALVTDVNIYDKMSLLCYLEKSSDIQRLFSASFTSRAKGRDIA